MGSGALKIGTDPEKILSKQGGIHGNSMKGNHPCMQTPTDTVTLKVAGDWNLLDVLNSKDSKRDLQRSA